METEAKFVVPDAATFKRISKATQFGAYKRGESKVKQVHDRYVDTPDHRFYGQHLYVRLRAGASDGALLLTVKRLGVLAQGAVHARDEYETNVPGLDVAAWPEGDVRGMVQEVAGDEPLTELVIVNQRRTVSHLLDGTREVAELSLDEVEIPAAGGPVKAYELEAELLSDGTLDDLGALSKVFIDEYHLAPQPLSKFERALSLTLPDHEPHLSEPVEPPAEAAAANGASIIVPAAMAAPKEAARKRPRTVLPTDTMEVAGKKVLQAQFEAMLSNEEGTRAGTDPEALHDMRVATRRMRAALRIAGPYLEGKAARRVTNGVRSVTRSLGAVRDLDVLIERAKEFQARLPAEQQQDLDGLLSDWNSRRERSRKQMLRLLDSKAYARFAEDMDAFLEETGEDSNGPRSEVVVPVQVRHVLGSAIWTRYEEVRAYETVMDSPTLPQLHALRIIGKYLRYTLEFFRDVLPGNASTLIRDVVAMQDQLGALHDADVAAGLVREFIAAQPKKGKKKRRAEDSATQPPPGLAAYLANLEGTVESTKAGFGSTWQRLTGPKWRTQLAAAAAV
jgi:triphosphatase